MRKCEIVECNRWSLGTRCGHLGHNFRRSTEFPIVKGPVLRSCLVFRRKMSKSTVSFPSIRANTVPVYTLTPLSSGAGRLSHLILPGKSALFAESKPSLLRANRVNEMLKYITLGGAGISRLKLMDFECRLGIYVHLQCAIVDDTF